MRNALILAAAAALAVLVLCWPPMRASAGPAAQLGQLVRGNLDDQSRDRVAQAGTKRTKNSKVTCGVTPTAVPAAAMAYRNYITVQNNDAVDVWLAPDPTLTAGLASTSLKAAAGGGTYVDNLDSSQILYCITASGSAVVQVAER